MELKDWFALVGVTMIIGGVLIAAPDRQGPKRPWGIFVSIGGFILLGVGKFIYPGW